MARQKIRYQPVSGNELFDALYSLSVAVLEEAGDHPEARASLELLRSDRAMQIAWQEGLMYLVVEGKDVAARFPEEVVKETMAAAKAARPKAN